MQVNLEWVTEPLKVGYVRRYLIMVILICNRLEEYSDPENWSLYVCVPLPRLDYTPR